MSDLLSVDANAEGIRYTINFPGIRQYFDRAGPTAGREHIEMALTAIMDRIDEHAEQEVAKDD